MFDSCDCLGKRFELNPVALSQSQLKRRLISIYKQDDICLNLSKCKFSFHHYIKIAAF